MILKKVMIDNKVVFEEISFEDALKYENKEELVFTDEDEQDEFEDALEELEEAKEEIEELEEEINDLKNKNIHLNFNGKGFNFDFGNLFSMKSGSKSNKLIGALPFMNKEDTYEIVEEILNNKEEYKDVSLVSVFPFLEKKDCDKLFNKFVLEDNNKSKQSIICLAPFISKECLSSLVDEYIKGNYQEVQIDHLYPFMDSQDVKRVFKYIISKKEEN